MRIDCKRCATTWLLGETLESYVSQGWRSDGLFGYFCPTCVDAIIQAWNERFEASKGK